jgi:hypothetical protein
VEPASACARLTKAFETSEAFEAFSTRTLPKASNASHVAVTSRRVGWDTDLADRGSLRSQRQAPNRAAPTDDFSASALLNIAGLRRDRLVQSLAFNLSTASLNFAPRSA